MKKEKGKERKVSLFIILGVRDIIGTRNSEEVSLAKTTKRKGRKSKAKQKRRTKHHPRIQLRTKVNVFGVF